MHTPKQAAAWLQQRLVRDETAFRRRSGASDALNRLRTSSEALPQSGGLGLIRVANEADMQISYEVQNGLVRIQATSRG